METIKKNVYYIYACICMVLTDRSSVLALTAALGTDGEIYRVIDDLWRPQSFFSWR